MKHTVLSLATLLGSCLIARGQSSVPMEAPAVQQTLNSLGTSGNMSAIRTFDGRVVGLKGTPLLYANWLPGEATLVNGAKISNAQFKYNVPDRRLFVLRNSRDSTQIEAYNVKSLTLQAGADGTPQQYEHLPKLKNDVSAIPADLVRVICQGTYSLVQLPVKGFYKATSSSPYGEARDYNEFRDEPVYLLLRPDGTAEKVKLTKKSLTGALQDQADAFTKYLKDNKLSADVEGDVAKALAALTK